MKVVTDSNETIDLGVTETSPTISITDYSRRVTDDFGVTTVVPRKFARRLSVRMLLATSAIDAVQRRLAGLRAVPANWIADDSLAWLAVRGFFKDFEIDVADARSSFCTLSVEGLAESETVADNGIEPAPVGSTSSLRLLQPVAVTGSSLVSSSVLENDYPAWSSTTTYAKGARVILTPTHRIYESAAAGNVGNNPTGTSGAWIDVAPTNRWAMFDEALGTSTLAAGSLSVVLTGSATTAIALVDVTGASVRVQASGYDRTQAAGAGAIVFADLPSVTGQITVTVTGSGAVAVGTLLIGRIVGLGITEASPTAGITDYSRKEIDDFGEVSVVQRAWAKRMSARALVRTEAVDQVANRIASVRARPCLWIADGALDAVTIYGFFKDFSIEVGERVSKLSLSVEGLSKAAPIATASPEAGGLIPRGNYDPAVTYSEGDVVQYDGSSWYFIAETPSSGQPPPLLPATENAYWRVFAQRGTNGEDAPLVLVQWSVDGMTGWHANYADGDLYQRQSNDNGATWGPAVRVVGEGASAGADGISPSIIFRRLATVPATPQQDTGNPPPGWFDAPPPGSDLLWQSVSRFRGGTQLEPWSAPVRISGPAGGSAFTLIDIQYCSNPGPTSVTKRGGGNDWNAKARTGEFAKAATVSGLLVPGGFIGLTTDPYAPNYTYDTIDYAIHWSEDTGIFVWRNGVKTTGIGLRPTGDAPVRATVRTDGAFLTYFVEGYASPAGHAVNSAEEQVCGVFALYREGSSIDGITFAVDGLAGKPGKDAPLVRVQWSIDGVTNWHDNYMGADVYQRQSTDGGVTWGPAYRVIGENGTVGQDGSFTSFVFRRSATIPATPANNTGNPPTGWTDGPPAGTDYLWQTKATFRGATQLTSWTAPARISGDDGFGVKVTPDNFQQAVFSTGANKPSWTGGQGTITLNKGGQIITSGVTYSLSNADGMANLTLSGNVFTFSGAIGDSGTFLARAHYNGQTYEARVNVQKVYDGEPAFKGSVGFGSGGASASLVVPAGRQCVISGAAQYSITGNNLGNNQQRMSIYWSNKTDGGPLNFLGSADGTVAYRRNVGTPSDPVIEAQAGTVSASFPFTAPSPSKEITYTIVVEPIVAQAPASVIGSGGLEVRS